MNMTYPLITSLVSLMGLMLSYVFRRLTIELWRIGIVDANASDEANIKIRYNNLFKQFSNNDKYEVYDGSTLEEKEDISFEMFVNNKRYDAYFTFKDKSIHGRVWYTIVGPYGEYGIMMFYENLDNEANGDDL